MTTKECYELMGADYEDVLGRLMMEKLVKKFLYKFADAKDMEDLKSSLAAKDYETAFRMAHNLKGVCANLSITKLGAPAGCGNGGLRCDAGRHKAVAGIGRLTRREPGKCADALYAAGDFPLGGSCSAETEHRSENSLGTEGTGKIRGCALCSRGFSPGRFL